MALIIVNEIRFCGCQKSTTTFSLSIRYRVCCKDI